MADLIEKILAIEGGALAITRDTATKLVNNLVQNGEVKPEEAQPLIDELVARGEEELATMRKDLAAQVATLNTTTITIQDLLNTQSKEAPEIALQELDLLRGQLADVQRRLAEREADKQIDKNTRRTLGQAQKQLRIARARLVQATQEIRTGYIDRAQRSVKVLGITLNKASYILLTGGGTLAMTREKATELVNDLVQKGEVKREDAQALIDELVVWGKEARANLLKALDTQVIALSTIAEAIQSNLSTGTKEAVEKAHQELDTLGEQLTGVRDRVSEAEKQVEESTRRTLEQAREQLAIAQTHLFQVTEKIDTWTVEEMQRGVEALYLALDKASYILLTGGDTLAMTREKATELVNDLVQKGEVKREDAQALIDELAVRGKEARANLLKALDTQVIALSTIAKAIQSNLSTGTKEAVETVHQELDTLGEQFTGVRDRVSEAEKQVEESTRRTLEQAREQLAAAQTDLVQAAENIRAGAVEEAQRLVEASRTALDKVQYILRNDK